MPQFSDPRMVTSDWDLRHSRRPCEAWCVFGDILVQVKVALESLADVAVGQSPVTLVDHQK